MTKVLPQFLIAAPCSGSGKTTVCRGIMAALVRRGLSVQPYKCGPDYIDTKFHTAVCNRPSVNLDTFMASPEHVRNLYSYYATGADACVVEGMMGLFDGYERDLGSSSEVASLLRLPVLMVVDARSAAYSVAALLEGFSKFRPDTYIAGVIFNQVGSVNHYGILQESCASTGIPCFGYLPKDETLKQKSRYLGLDFSQEEGYGPQEYLARLVEQYIDIPRLLQAMMRPLATASIPFGMQTGGNLRIAVLRTPESFSFLYAEHIDILSRMGQVTYVNPEQDCPLPEGTGLLYLPGGYPEKHAVALSKSKRSLASIREYIAQGGRALAECGGMIYLSQGIWLDESPGYIPLCGVLPFNVSCQNKCRRLSLGYRQFEYHGQMLRGHEFHYTQIHEDCDTTLPATIAQVYNARRQAVPTKVFRHKNLIASYTHLYWGETDILRLFD